jgi:hypothetical protein
MFTSAGGVETEVLRWEPIEESKFKGPKWTTMPKESAENFYVVKSFASSERSRVLLACTVSGAVCVIKFLRDNGLNTCVIFRIDIDLSCDRFHRSDG